MNQSLDFKGWHQTGCRKCFLFLLLPDTQRAGNAGSGDTRHVPPGHSRLFPGSHASFPRRRRDRDGLCTCPTLTGFSTRFNLHFPPAGSVGKATLASGPPEPRQPPSRGDGASVLELLRLIRGLSSCVLPPPRPVNLWSERERRSLQGPPWV